MVVVEVVEEVEGAEDALNCDIKARFLKRGGARSDDISRRLGGRASKRKN